jgi:Ala-tRNA(Pro) deacylase
MPHTPASLFAFLDSHGIAHSTVEHPPLFTVAESQALRGDIPGAHTKNLFLKDKKGRIFLVVAVEDTELDLKTLHMRIGGSGRLSFGSADLMQELLGVVPGAVTPLGLIHDTGRRISVVLDEALFAHERINHHPLVNTMTTGLAPQGLLAFLAATGHTPQIMALAAKQA